MTTTADDWDLIGRYAATGSHAVFEAIVERHAGWVYAAALRRVRSADLANDVTQATFIVLARKAGALVRRRRPSSSSSLAAWLYGVVTYVAVDALRRRGTRRRHERLAARAEAIAEADESAEREIIAHLDAALDGLGRRDREAVILRYFDDRTLTEIATLQRVAASTVQRRLARSLARIGRHLRRHGISAAPAALPATLTAIGRLSAPASATRGLTALAAAAAGSLPAHIAGPIGLAHGAIKAMGLTKFKAAAAAVALVAVLGGGGAVATRYAVAQTRGAGGSQAAAMPGSATRVAIASDRPQFDAATFARLDAAGRLAFVRRAAEWRDRQLANFDYEVTEGIYNVNVADGRVEALRAPYTFEVRRSGERYWYTGHELAGRPGDPPRRYVGGWDGTVCRTFVAGNVNPASGVVRAKDPNGVIGVEFNNVLGFRMIGVERLAGRERVPCTRGLTRRRSCPGGCGVAGRIWARGSARHRPANSSSGSRSNSPTRRTRIGANQVP